MENDEIALQAIRQKAVYDLKLNKYVFVNKLIYLKDKLMIVGYTTQYRVSDYGKTWRLLVAEEYEQRYTLCKDFEKYLDKISKEDK